MNALIVVLGQFPGNSRIRVVQIAVEPGAAGAIVHAGRIGLAIGGQMLAQRALAGHAVLLAEAAHTVGTSVETVLAADALRLVHQHNARFAVAIRSARGAHLHAARMGALLALHGQVVTFDVRVGARRSYLHDTVVEGAQGQVILEFAAHDAAVATGAPVDVDDKTLPRHGRPLPRYGTRRCGWA